MNLRELISKHNPAAIAVANGPGVRQLERALEVQDTDPEGFFNLGVAYAKLSQRAKMLRAFRRMVELEPRYASRIAPFLGLPTSRVVEYLKSTR